MNLNTTPPLSFREIKDFRITGAVRAATRETQNTLTMSSTKPISAFQQVREIMLQPAPWADHEIEELMHQEPLPPNRGLMLPAEEESPSDEPQ